MNVLFINSHLNTGRAGQPLIALTVRFDGSLRFAASRLPTNQRIEPTEPDVFPKVLDQDFRMTNVSSDRITVSTSGLVFFGLSIGQRHFKDVDL